MSAPAPRLLNLTVRVTRIRSRNSKGVILFGHLVDVAQMFNDRTKAVVVRVPATLVNPCNFDVGEIWQVYGEATEIKRDVGRVVLTETQIEAIDVNLERPSGSQVVQWLSHNIRGIREVKAQKLWDAHGESLYDILDNENHDAIIDIIPSEEIRNGLFEEWLKNGDAKTLRFVQERGIPLEIARKAIKFHKINTKRKLLEDPYRMLSFMGSWKLVDQLAQEKFGVTFDDTRRLAAVLEEGLYKGLDDGHTCQPFHDLYAVTRKLLAPHPYPEVAFNDALLQGHAAGQFMVSESGDCKKMLHSAGAWVMEKTVAQFILDLLRSSEQNHPNADIDQIIADFESAEQQRLGATGFALNEAQRKAVSTSYHNRFSLITGGAGVGKTTVLKALYKALDTLGAPRFQMALSGRATARMSEATHEPATTIAGFICKVSSQEIAPGTIIVIDEASMLDLVSFYRLTRKLPKDIHLILVGDPYQLPPIGAGLIFHLLCEMPGIPATELTLVKRQARDSGIPVAAIKIRGGELPKLSTDPGQDVAFIPCPDNEIISTVMGLYDQDRKNTQILCATKSCRFAGTQEINRVSHFRYVAVNKPLMLQNVDTGELEDTGFRVGDLLLYTANNWQRNLQNGCLGLLTEVFDESCQVNIGSEKAPCIRTAVGKADYNGVEHYILDTDVDVMELAYGITVHKSQGSQFPRVIVPVRRSRILDRTLVYTAVTRAQQQVIMVGDEQAVRAAVEAQPKAFRRQVGLRVMLCEFFQVTCMF
ncbi:MAG: AAA family ATPase [Desulfobacterium sp.]|nr:AAA family ATPase [Desulfobacterium sp.]